MDLRIYDIIKTAVISQKAQKTNSNLSKLVLNVHIEANKPQVKEAVEKLFEVKVDTVRTAIRKGKTRKVGKRKVDSSDRKIAYVTLSEGYTLDLFGHSENKKEGAVAPKETKPKVSKTKKKDGE